MSKAGCHLERRHGLLGPQGEGAKEEGMDCWALKVKGRRKKAWTAGPSR